MKDILSDIMGWIFTLSILGGISFLVSLGGLTFAESLLLVFGIAAGITIIFIVILNGIESLFMSLFHA